LPYIVDEAVRGFGVTRPEAGHRSRGFVEDGHSVEPLEGER
jgi:hypothetical protein